MYCSVARSFHNDMKPTKKAFVYRCDGIKNLKQGDVVEVDTQYGVQLGVISSVFEEDLYNFAGLFRTNVIKKVHTNTVKAAVRRRFEEYKDIKVYTEFKRGRRVEKPLKKWFGEDYHYKLLKAICLGSIIKEEKQLISIWYRNLIIVVRKYTSSGMVYGVHLLSVPNGEKKWLTPTKASEEFHRLYANSFRKD